METLESRLSSYNKSQEDVTRSNLTTAQIVIDILRKPFEKRTAADLEKLVPLLMNAQFLKETKVRDKDVVDVCKRLRHVRIKMGKNVIHHGRCLSLNSTGDYGDLFYVIIRGTVVVKVPMLPLGDLSGSKPVTGNND